jgi:hypothetical protein
MITRCMRHELRNIIPGLVFVGIAVVLSLPAAGQGAGMKSNWGTAPPVIQVPQTPPPPILNPGVRPSAPGPSQITPNPRSSAGLARTVPPGQVCSVFRHHPCTPELAYPFSEQLQLTIESRDHDADAPRERGEADHENSEQLDTIRAVFSALRSCWVPPAKEDSRVGAQYSVRLSFKRDGEIFGKPRVSYVTPGLPEHVRKAYSDAVDAAIERCTPLAFSRRLGGALAGRPFAIRFIDKRSHS